MGYLFTFLLACGLALYGVPVARRAALKYGLVDKPDGRLKHQQQPTPYLGGLAIYLAFLVSLAFTFEFRQEVLGIVLAGTLVVMLGLIDDFGVLSPIVKLAGQLLAVVVLIKSGIQIQIASLPDWLLILLTFVWMIGIINAFNLLDIMDGLSAGVGVLCTTLLFFIALLNGDTMIAFMLVALAGSLIGFLRYNLYPAKIYMGDAGSLFLGFMLGALSMVGKYALHHPVSLLTPVLILGVPIFDTFFVMYIRFLRGLPIFLGSPDHLAIRLRNWGLTVPQVVGISYVATGVVGGIGLGLIFAPQNVALALTASTALMFAVAALLVARFDVTRKKNALGDPVVVGGAGSEERKV